VDGKPEIDKDDASLTRSDAHLKRLWKEAGVKVVKQEVADGFPDGIYPVMMYSLCSAVDPIHGGEA
jgi:protein N-terminal methyltransferase